MSTISRRTKVKEFLHLVDIEAFITNYRPNFMYLSGFTGSTAFLIITGDKDYIVVDGRYILRAKNEVDDDIQIVDTLDKSSLIKKTRDLLKDLGIGTIGIEKNNLKVSDYLFFSEYFDVKPFNYVIESIRSEKDRDEVEKIKKALLISERVLQEAEAKLYEGVGKLSEIELANFIKRRIIELGANGLAFEPIVAFGKNTALPHYTPSDNILKEGDFVIIDMGAVVDQYHSDITRSFCIGKNIEFERLYKIVLEAQIASIESIRAGVPVKNPYIVATKVFEKYGLKDYFTHGLGHGVGLEIHELPSMSAAGFGFLKNNNVLTVEPGIYLPEIGGIRIEDMVIVEDNSVNILTRYPK